MDPNETLRVILQIANRVMDEGSSDDPEGDLDDLSARLLDLNEWITRGGFLPKRWIQKEGA